MDNYQILLEKLTAARETFLARQTKTKEKISVLEQDYISTQYRIFKLNRKIEQEEKIRDILIHYKERLEYEKNSNAYNACGFALLLIMTTYILPILFMQYLHIRPIVFNLNTIMSFIVSVMIDIGAAILYAIILNVKTTKKFKEIAKNNNVDTLSKRITRNISKVRKLTKVNKKTSEKIEQLKKQEQSYDATISECNEIMAMIKMSYSEAIIAVTTSQNYEELINKEFELDKSTKEIITRVRKKENLGGK